MPKSLINVSELQPFLWASTSAANEWYYPKMALPSSCVLLQLYVVFLALCVFLMKSLEIGAKASRSNNGGESRRLWDRRHCHRYLPVKGRNWRPTLRSLTLSSPSLPLTKLFMMSMTTGQERKPLGLVALKTTMKVSLSPLSVRSPFCECSLAFLMSSGIFIHFSHCGDSYLGFSFTQINLGLFLFLFSTPQVNGCKAWSEQGREDSSLEAL